jgi:hypothetical protein
VFQLDDGLHITAEAGVDAVSIAANGTKTIATRRSGSARIIGRAGIFIIAPLTPP